MTAKRSLAAIKKLLRSRNLEQILQGVEVVAGLDDVDVWDAVLEGVGWEIGGERSVYHRRQKPIPTIGRLIPSDIFQANRKSLYWDEMATAFLLAASDHPLRKKITHLTLSQVNLWEHIRIDFRCPDFSRFSNLRNLELVLSDPDVLPARLAANIEELTVKVPGWWEKDRTLSMPKADELKVLNLEVNFPNTEVTLGDLPALERFSATNCLVAMPTMPKLRELRAHTVRVPDLEVRAPNLEILSFNSLVQPQVNVPPATFEYFEEGAQHVQVCADSLGSIDRLRGIDRLQIVGGTALPVSLEPLMGMPELAAVDLQNVKVESVAILEDHPNLRMIALPPDAVDKKALSPVLRKMVSVAKTVDLRKGAKKPLPSAEPPTKPRRASSTPSTLTPTQKKHLSKIKRLLTTPDAGSIRQGVELAASLGSGEVVGELLDGVTIADGVLQPNKLFSAGRFRQPWLDMALLHLVAQTSPELAAQVTTASLGYVKAKPAMSRISLDGLGSLGALRSLRVEWSVGDSVDLAPLNDVTTLRTLELDVPAGAGEAVIPGIANVQMLTAKLATLDERGFWPDLQSIDIENRSRTVLTQDKLPKLESVRCRGEITLRGFAHLKLVEIAARETKYTWNPKVAALDLDACGQIGTLDVAHTELTVDGGLERIDTVALREVRNKNYEHLSKVRSIGSIDLRRSHGLDGIDVPSGTRVVGGVVDLSAQHTKNWGVAARLDGVELLRVGGVTETTSLDLLPPMPGLRGLHLNHSSGITDLTPLIGRGLQMITLFGSGVTSIPEELEGVARFERSRYISELHDGAITQAEQENFSSERSKLVLASALNSRDLDVMLRAIGEVAGEDDGEEAIAHVLEYVTWRNQRVMFTKAFNSVPSELRPAVLAALLRNSPEDSPKVARWKKVSALSLPGWPQGEG